MDLDDRPRGWLAAAADWLDATPVDLVGLVVLLVSSVAATGLLWWRAQPTTLPAVSPTPVLTAPPTEPPGPVLVHVAGAVTSPGVVEVPAGARVLDAVQAAGGLLPDAEPAALNLAREVSDGEQLRVPRIGEVPDAGAEGATAATATTDGKDADGRIDVNRASASQLEELPGIGPVLAQRIVSFRDQHGPFGEPGDLREVPGIGERTFQSLVELISTG